MPPSLSNPIARSIRALITDHVTAAGTITRYRAALVGFAQASDPRFVELSRLVPGHLQPHDLLPAAKSVCAFFLPFEPQVVRSNESGELASEGWARAYVETNALLAEICALLANELGQRGIRVAWEPPTHNFDAIRLVSAWSHKSVAAIAGLGRFGHHHMLITRAGCAGRLGSVVLDAEIADRAMEDPKEELCTYDRGCRVCIRQCPANALTEEGFDRVRCYAQCLKNDELFPLWTADVCGKCATGPCAALNAVDPPARVPPLDPPCP